jgi:hypothetical protein
MLGDTLLEMAEKQKSPGNLNLLVAFTLQEDVRHLRLLATYAAWQSAPDAVMAAFLDKAADGDDKHAMRAVEAAGLIAPLLKDRTAYAKILEVARGERVYPGIEAARALNRAMDRRLEREIVDAACRTPDNHVRKHLVWAVMDLEGDEKPASRIFEPLRGRQGPAGKNADECVQILLDKLAAPFEWNPSALKGTAEWWKSGRPKGPQTEIGFRDDESKAKVGGWFAGLKKEAPAWENLVNSVLHKVVLRTNQREPDIFDLKKKALAIDGTEMARCETDWQGAYVLARDAGIGLCAILGEPAAGHRGWEPAFVEIHSFMKSTRHSAGKLDAFVDGKIGEKPWP